MIHPHGRCGRCGERVYEHIEGGYLCHNCGTRYHAQDDGGTTIDSMRV